MPKPLLRWPGGKARVLPYLTSFLPTAYNYYYEPFIGGGALFHHIKPEFAFIGDLNPDLINVYNAVKYSPNALIEALCAHHHGKKYFYELRNKDRSSAFHNMSKIKKAARFIYLNKTCFNGYMRYNKAGQCNSGWGYLKKAALPSEDQVTALHKALRGVRIGYQPFDRMRAMVKRGDFVYLDPPYDKETSGSMDNYLGSSFGVKGQFAVFSLCVWLDKIGARFMLSNAGTQLILRLYREFNIREIPVTRTFTSKGSGRGKTTELIITNY